MARYQLVLTDTDLRDEDVVRSVSSRALGTRVALLALLFVVLAPFAAAGFVANIVPVRARHRRRAAPRRPGHQGHDPSPRRRDRLPPHLAAHRLAGFGHRPAGQGGLGGLVPVPPVLGPGPGPVRLLAVAARLPRHPPLRPGGDGPRGGVARAAPGLAVLANGARPAGPAGRAARAARRRGRRGRPDRRRPGALGAGAWTTPTTSRPSCCRESRRRRSTSGVPGAEAEAADVDQLGCSDCERIRPGFLRQPVNALSSLLYLGAAAGIVAEAQRRPAAERTRMRRFAIAVAMNGVGSFAYHGPGGRGARWLHDVGVVSSLLLMAAADGSELGYDLVPDWLALPVAGGLTAAEPLSEPAQLVAGASLLAAEIARSRDHRRRRRRRRSSTVRRAGRDAGRRRRRSTPSAAPAVRCAVPTRPPGPRPLARDHRVVPVVVGPPAHGHAVVIRRVASTHAAPRQMWWRATSALSAAAAMCGSWTSRTRRS